MNPQILVSNADKYSLNSNNETIVWFEGNVTLNADKLKISKAEKVIIDKKLNKITVFGFNEFSFDGKMVIVPTFDGKHTRLEYTLSEDVAYIK